MTPKASPKASSLSSIFSSQQQQQVILKLLQYNHLQSLTLPLATKYHFIKSTCLPSIHQLLILNYQHQTQILWIYSPSNIIVRRSASYLITISTNLNIQSFKSLQPKQKHLQSDINVSFYIESRSHKVSNISIKFSHHIHS